MPSKVPRCDQKLAPGRHHADLPFTPGVPAPTRPLATPITSLLRHSGTALALIGLRSKDSDAFLRKVAAEAGLSLRLVKELLG